MSFYVITPINFSMSLYTTQRGLLNQQNLTRLFRSEVTNFYVKVNTLNPKYSEN